MLKPDGQVKILDFGVATRLPNRDNVGTTESVQDETHSLKGTPAYMSPEVLLQKHADQRADLFSLGVVFYEMLARRHPFKADTFIATTDQILHVIPPRIRDVNPGVPSEIDTIIFKMFAKKPADRYPNTKSVLADLRALKDSHTSTRLSLTGSRPSGLWFAIVMIVCAMIVGAGLFLALVPSLRSRFNPWRNFATTPQEKELAVLPFEVVGDDPEGKPFAAGLTETLTAKLTQLGETPQLQIVPASEVLARGVSTPEQARKEFGVNLVLEGSLHRSGNLVRVTSVLIDTKSSRQLHADELTESANDAFQVEDEVVASAAKMLDISPKKAAVLAGHGTQEPAAYDYYLQGRGYLQDFQLPQNTENAILLFDDALENDKNYGLAFAGLGEAYWRKYEYTHDNQWVKQAKAACARAQTLGNAGAEAHICLGTVDKGTGEYKTAASEFLAATQLDSTNDAAYAGLASAYDRLGQIKLAEDTYQRSIDVRPNYPFEYVALGSFYFSHGRYEDASKAFSHSVALAPDSFVGYSDLGGAYLAEGRYKEAIDALRHSIAIHPTYGAYSNLGFAYFGMRRYEESAKTFELALKMDDRDYAVWGNLGDANYWAPGRRPQSVAAYEKAIKLGNEKLEVNPRQADVESYLAAYQAMLGEKSVALTTLDHALKLSPRDPNVLFNAAQIYTQFGDDSAAEDWLAKAIAAGVTPSTITDTPNFDRLKDEPRFKALVQPH